MHVGLWIVVLQLVEYYKWKKKYFFKKKYNSMKFMMKDSHSNFFKRSARLSIVKNF